jgi:hypothetical protein
MTISSLKKSYLGYAIFILAQKASLIKCSLSKLP